MSRHNKDRRASRVSTTEPALTIPTNGLTITEAFRRFVYQIPNGRKCDGCTACCYGTGVLALGKPPLSDCEHQTSTGCGVYGDHPFECKEYACVWKMGWGGEGDRPNRSGVMLHLDRHPVHPDRPDYSSVEVIELRPGAVEERFPHGHKDVVEMLHGDKSLIITLHLHGTPRARPPWIKPPYDSSPLPTGQEDYVGNELVLIQLGVMDSVGTLHTKDGSHTTPEQRRTYIEGLVKRA